jgi:hypothetical protein
MRHLKGLVLICSLITLALSNAGEDEPRSLQTAPLPAASPSDLVNAKAAMAAMQGLGAAWDGSSPITGAFSAALGALGGLPAIGPFFAVAGFALSASSTGPTDTQILLNAITAVSNQISAL